MMASPPPPARILIRGVNWLGDAVMTTPALLRLREAFPAAHIAMLTPEKLADLWVHHPAVDAIHAFARQETIRHVASALRPEGFDAAIAFPNSTRSALELWWARIPMRVGYGGRGRFWLLSHTVRRRNGWTPMRKLSVRTVHRLNRGSRTEARRDDYPAGAHHLRDYLDLVAVLGASSEPLPPRLGVSPAEIRQARERFRLAPDNHRCGPLVGINAGAEYGPAKRWPPDRFIEAAAWVHQRIPCRWVVLGGAADRSLSRWLALKLAQAIAPKGVETGGSQESVIHLAGQTSLRELCAVLSMCRALLTNDTGPMHVAAAVGARVVVPFGSTSPALTAPGLPGDVRHRLLLGRASCAPCFRRECPVDLDCLRSVTPEAVGKALLGILTGPTTSGATVT
ncbi:MAG: lipopolysaccharide heptosyltransferase II [Verrucomicrobiales bacterium]|nr:lipopolysaccharide heptosyltransferase II [Verrucomicrobiales bacterium]